MSLRRRSFLVGLLLIVSALSLFGQPPGLQQRDPQLAAASDGVASATVPSAATREMTGAAPGGPGTPFVSTAPAGLPSEAALGWSATSAAGEVRAENNGLEIEGTFSYSISTPYITIRADKVANYRNGGTSGSLRLEVWATTNPVSFGGTINHFTLGSHQLGQLAGGYSWTNISSGSLPVSFPPRGTFYLTMALLEYTQSGWVYQDLAPFNDRGDFLLAIEGNVGYAVSGSSVRLTADQVSNDASPRTGTLRLELWAFAQPFSQGMSGYSLGLYRLGELEPGYVFRNIDGTVAFSRPPDGTYYLTMFLTEYQSNGEYAWVDYVNFPDAKTWGQVNPPQVNSFTASPATIAPGGSATLSWTSSNASSATISGIGNVATSGTTTVQPNATTTYTLTVSNAAGQTATRSTTVTVSNNNQGCSATRLCLQGQRFQISVQWRDFQGNTGSGRAVPMTSDTGHFWFFNSANVELVVKVLDGRPINGKWWVFYGALSNVEYTITVFDSELNRTRTYFNPSGQFASTGDTSAFSDNGLVTMSGWARH